MMHKRVAQASISSITFEHRREARTISYLIFVQSLTRLSAGIVFLLPFPSRYRALNLFRTNRDLTHDRSDDGSYFCNAPVRFLWVQPFHQIRELCFSCGLDPRFPFPTRHRAVETLAACG